MHAAGTWMADVPVLYFCGMRASGRDTRNQTQFRTHVCLFMWVYVCVGHLTNVTKQIKTNDFKLYICQKNKRAALRRIRNEPEGPGRTWKDDLASVSSVSSVSLVSSCLLLSPVSTGPGLAAPKAQPKAKPRRPLRKGRKNSDQILKNAETY